ncbi:MAG TPA: response regulator [Ktedonobacteraceae bacterium]|nr:response regulator [Ktedonobacteraceae bacterium]
MVTINVSAPEGVGFLPGTPHVSAILVVMPDPYQGEAVTRHFSSRPHHHMELMTSAAAALNFVKHIKPNLILLEYHLPDMDGLALYDLLHETRELACIPTIIFGVPLPTQALAFVRTQQLVILNTPIDLKTLGREMMQLGIPVTMNYQGTVGLLPLKIPKGV